MAHKIGPWAAIFCQKDEKYEVSPTAVGILSPTLGPTTPQTYPKSFCLIWIRIWTDFEYFLKDFGNFADAVEEVAGKSATVCAVASPEGAKAAAEERPDLDFKINQVM